MKFKFLNPLNLNNFSYYLSIKFSTNKEIKLGFQNQVYGYSKVGAETSVVINGFKFTLINII